MGQWQIACLYACSLAAVQPCLNQQPPSLRQQHQKPQSPHSVVAAVQQHAHWRHWLPGAYAAVRENLLLHSASLSEPKEEHPHPYKTGRQGGATSTPPKVLAVSKWSLLFMERKARFDGK